MAGRTKSTDDFSNNSSVKGGWSIVDVYHRLSSQEVSGTTLTDRLQGPDIGGMNSFRDIGSSSAIARGTSDDIKSK